MTDKYPAREFTVTHWKATSEYLLVANQDNERKMAINLGYVETMERRELITLKRCDAIIQLNFDQHRTLNLVFEKDDLADALFNAICENFYDFPTEYTSSTV